MTDSNPLILYDISSPIQPRSYAPNPSKARLALSFKRVPFQTTWVDLLDIPKVRQQLHCPAVRKFDDGSDFFTLPMLQNPNTNTVVGDSLEIATYLDDKFPDAGAGRLFPPDITGVGLDYESPNKDIIYHVNFTTNDGCKHAKYARFNVQIDATFTAHCTLVAYYMPFNPETAAGVRELFAKRARLKSWDEVCIQGEAREKMKASFKESLASLAKLYMVNASGPYLEGDRATYADLIVGGWLNMMATCMPKDEWHDFRTWHDGVFARLHDALQANYFECK